MPRDSRSFAAWSARVRIAWTFSSPAGASAAGRSIRSVKTNVPTSTCAKSASRRPPGAGPSSLSSAARRSVTSASVTPGSSVMSRTPSMVSLRPSWLLASSWSFSPAAVTVRPSSSRRKGPWSLTNDAASFANSERSCSLLRAESVFVRPRATSRASQRRSCVVISLPGSAFDVTDAFPALDAAPAMMAGQRRTSKPQKRTMTEATSPERRRSASNCLSPAWLFVLAWNQ